MKKTRTSPIEASRAAATEWVLRLQAPKAGEADWLAFESWLQAAPQSRPAFDEAMALSLELDERAAAIGAELEFAAERAAAPTRFAGRRQGVGALWWSGGVFAVLSIVVAAALLYPQRARPPVVYATAKGEHRTLRMADGTVVDLASSSRIVVSSGGRGREATLTDGEAAFKVAHDTGYPFTVAVGDRQVRDIGTEFDIRRGRDELAVTVLHGMVSVGPLADPSGPSTMLGAGRQLRHQLGAQVSTVTAVSAEDAFAWKGGRLIYRDQPLATVVEDLNRDFPEPLRIDDGRVAAIRFTGVITVDDEPATIRRLTALLPVSATPSNGAIVLAAREYAR